MREADEHLIAFRTRPCACRSCFWRAAVRFLRRRAIKAFRGVVLECTQTGERLVDVALLRLELADAVGDPLEREPVLSGAGLGR